MSRQRETFNEINRTPLTDIFLVLLIIMMVIAPLLDQQGLNLTVPENVDAEQVKNDPKILTVNVSETTDIILTVKKFLLKILLQLLNPQHLITLTE